MDDSFDYSILDPTEDELYKAYRNELLDRVCKSLKVYGKKDGYIMMSKALKVIRSFKK